MSKLCLYPFGAFRPQGVFEPPRLVRGTLTP